MIKGILTSILSLCTFSFFAQDADSLLTIEELYSLREYAICNIPESDSFIVRDPLTSEQITDFSIVKRAVIYSNYDTLRISHDHFPNLVSLTIGGTFINEMIAVSKLEKLQYLDLHMDHTAKNKASFKLDFPPTFWKLENMQVLKIHTNTLSDISENIIHFKHLQVLQISDFGESFEPELPWSLLLLKNFKLLILPTEKPAKFRSDFNSLLETHATFTIMTSGYFSDEQKLLQDGSLNHLVKPNRSVLSDGNLKVENDSLKLVLQLDDKNHILNGNSYFLKNNKIVQKRSYRNGVAHGRWKMRPSISKEIRKYKHGQPRGTWKFYYNRQEGDRLPLYPRVIAKYRKNGQKIIFKYKRRNITFLYINYNDLYYFNELGIDLKRKADSTN